MNVHIIPDLCIGGELYSTVGVETPIDAGGHPYQINRTPMANFGHPQHPYAFLERIRHFSSKHYHESNLHAIGKLDGCDGHCKKNFMFVTSEREASFLLIYTKNMSMSGRPAGRGHAFERLISREP